MTTFDRPQPDAAEPNPAGWYALLHRGNPGDVEFYVGRCAGTEHVLELGVGYGRVASALVAAGWQVTGIDVDPGLLELARASIADLGFAHRFRAYQQDMRSFRLDARYGRILIPYSGLYCLLDEGSVLECLGRCREHLAPGGRVVLDVYEADSFHEAYSPEDFDETLREPVVDVVANGQSFSVFERSHWFKQEQRLDIHYEYRDQDQRVVHTSTIRHRYLLQAQLERLLETAGFTLRAIHGGFAGEPTGYDADVVVVEAEPSG